MLKEEGDLAGARQQYRLLVENANEHWAPEALESLAVLLQDDADDARVAFQQAIDDGFHGADWLIEKLNPSPKPTSAELDALPSPFDPRNMVCAGLEVLSHGLPELPEQLSYLMAIPVAYWTAPHSAVVLFLRFQREGRQHREPTGRPPQLSVAYCTSGSLPA